MSTLLACDRNLHLQCRMVRHADSRRPDAIPSPDKVAQHSLHLPHPPDARRQSRLPPLTAHTALVAGPAPRPAQRRPSLPNSRDSDTARVARRA